MKFTSLIVFICTLVHIFLLSLVKETSSSTASSSTSQNSGPALPLTDDELNRLVENDLSKISKFQFGNKESSGISQEDVVRTLKELELKNILEQGLISKTPPLDAVQEKQIEQANNVDNSIDEYRDVVDLFKRKWSRFNSWGKRNGVRAYINGGGKRWKGVSAWGKRSDGDLGSEKRWKGVSAWGKRGELESDKRWKGVSAWGKRSIFDLENEKRWKGVSAWGKRDEIDIEKKWKGVSAWGKRNDFNIGNIKKWKGVSAWGKRDEIDNEKRWRGVSAWGKRDEIDNEKRWKGVSAWGKRDEIDNEKRWKGVSAWGKRNELEIDNEKKWKGVSAWGKRDKINNEKRWKGVPAWGKRASELQNNWGDPVAVNKRGPPEQGNKWRSIKAWGKRDSISDLRNEDLYTIFGNEKNLENSYDSYLTRNNVNSVIDTDKRSNEPAADGGLEESGLWGQRPYRYNRNWLHRNMWSKRPSWSKTGFTSWGKRSSPDRTERNYDVYYRSSERSGSKNELAEKTGLDDIDQEQGTVAKSR